VKMMFARSVTAHNSNANFFLEKKSINISLTYPTVICNYCNTVPAA
jgi:hypothetical protein